MWTPGLPRGVPASLVTVWGGTGLITRMPSPTARALGLGPPDPQRSTRAAEPSGIRWGGFSPPSRYSYRHSHSPPLHQPFPADFAADGDAPLPCPLATSGIRGVGGGLEPRWIIGAGTPRPVSYYALFEGWLLLSQPPGCLRVPTTFPTKAALRDLSRRSGLCPSRRRIFAPAVSLHGVRARGIRRLTWLGRRLPPHHTSALPPRASPWAAPQGISGRTSYLRVRLAFHPYPQVLRALCNGHRCGPPPPLTAASACPWVAHPGSGLPRATGRPLRTRFRCGSGCRCLSLAARDLSPVRSTKSTPSPHQGGSDGLRACGFRRSFTPLQPGYFSPFPHGTLHYRSRRVFSLGPWSAQLPTELHVLGGTHAVVAPGTTCHYGTLTLCGRPFQWRSRSGTTSCSGLLSRPQTTRPTPDAHRPTGHSARPVWAARVSLATTPRILSLPRGT
jgi:hypothetical protein